MNVFTDILRISVQSLLTRIVKHIYKEEYTAPLAPGLANSLILKQKRIFMILFSLG